MASATDASGTLSDSINLTLDTSAAKTFTYDNNGSLTGVSWRTNITTYAYDYDNRIKSVVQTGAPNVNYKYDYFGRRIEKNVGGIVTKYIYDGGNIIAEYDNSGSLITKYTYGPNIDEPIRIEKLADVTEICYHHYDGLGSVTDLTNEQGQHIEHYIYSPFGKTKIYDPTTGLKRSESVIDNAYRFTARQWDDETKLYFYRARYYDPNIGRFLQTDPVGYNAGDLSLYRYCNNNPTNVRDPYGTNPALGMANLLKDLASLLKNLNDSNKKQQEQQAEDDDARGIHDGLDYGPTPWEQGDTDKDGWPNETDPHWTEPTPPTWPLKDPGLNDDGQNLYNDDRDNYDMDKDGIPDRNDLDTDGDGMWNWEDDFPFDNLGKTKNKKGQ